jgi:translation initiation factor 6 (eIF-6)
MATVATVKKARFIGTMAGKTTSRAILVPVDVTDAQLKELAAIFEILGQEDDITAVKTLRQDELAV